MRACSFSIDLLRPSPSAFATRSGKRKDTPADVTSTANILPSTCEIRVNSDVGIPARKCRKQAFTLHDPVDDCNRDVTTAIGWRPEDNYFATRTTKVSSSSS
jgi:hypothetical protein